MNPPRRAFYGWWVLTGAAVASALGGATTSYGFSLLMVPLTAEFGWSRAALSGAISLARLESGLVGPVEGMLVDRYGARRMMLIGIPLAGLGLALLAFLGPIQQWSGLDSLLLFYLIYVGMVAVGNTFSTNTAPSTAVANWFRRRRGLALGLYSSGHAVGAALWVPVLGYVIQVFSWREAVLMEGIAIVVLGVPAALLVRHSPEPYGQLPDGATPQAPGNSGAARLAALPAEPEFTMRQAVHSRAFWLLAVCFSLRVLVTNAVQVHLAALLQDTGMDALAAAGMVSALAASSIVGRFGMSWLGDVMDKRVVFQAGLVLMVIGVVIVAFAQETWQVLLFLVCYSPAYGGLASLQALLRAEYFGRRAFASIGGAMNAITMAGTIIGPLVAGYLYDVSGSYRTAMIIFAGFGVATIILFSFLRPARVGEATPAAAQP
ncbi:MAG: MFS transporter [Chloroflexota bacterium]